MVRLLALLRNVGKFDNVSAGAYLQFDRLTMIYGENARGKTTLAAILRSLSSGNAGPILERRKLGSRHPPHVVIDFDAGAPAIFQNGAWSRTAPDIAIFDDTFVAENVCSGIEVAASHRQNLHELIVGAEGVALSDALQGEVNRIEEHSARLRELGDAIPKHVRGGLDVDKFCDLAPEANLRTLIEEAERRSAAARDAARVAAAPTFPPLSLPTIALDNIAATLNRSVSDLDAVALERVQAHLARLGVGGEAWVSEGVKLANRTAEQGNADCPFCAQDLRSSPVLSHYRRYFGEAYDGLKSAIAGALRDFATVHAGDVPAAFERTVRQVVERRAFWKDFAAVPMVEVDTAQIALKWKIAREGVRRFLRQSGRPRWKTLWCLMKSGVPSPIIMPDVQTLKLSLRNFRQQMPT
jgi:wobble nucleotide-excising tRNase